MALAADPGAIEKSCPVPMSVTVCGPPNASSVIVRVLVLVPLAIGSKKTPIEQLEPPSLRILPQALRTPKSAELVVMLVMCSKAFPVFVRVTV